MGHRISFALAAILSGAAIVGCAHLGAIKSPTPAATDQERLDAIRHAQVWKATDVPSMDLMAGPQGKGAFPANALVTCNYLPKKLSGATPKFACVIPPDDELKVKYGRANGEVYAEVAAARLLWALGFYAEREYPVRVECNGCPPAITGEMASIERKFPGTDIETKHHVGWAWSELDLVDPASGGAPMEQRDALKLLAVFIQHTDSKPEQQRLVCVGEKKRKSGLEVEACEQTVMLVHDLGMTFGRANYLNRASAGGVNLEAWSHARVWKDPKRCLGNLPESATGTLDNPLITEEGRRFLAGLLVQLTDAQLHDLFTVARFNRRSAMADAAPDTSSIDEWVAAFKEKRDEIVNRTCPG